MIDLNTFGPSPAAHHLVRYLNGMEDSKKQSKIRSVGIVIKSFNKNLSGIRVSVNHETLTDEVAANFLRLLRLDANNINIQNDKVLTALVKNVVIGQIKKRIRQVTIYHKLYTITKDTKRIPQRATSARVIDGNTYYYYMGQQLGYFENGVWVYDWGLIEDPITPEILHARSQKRIARRTEI